MLVCIDFDGVISDSLDQQMELIRTAQSMLQCGRIPTLDDIRTIPSLTYVDIAIRIGVPSEKLQHWSSTVLSLSQASKAEIVYFPTIIGVIEKIARKAKIAVITSNFDFAVRQSLEKQNIVNCVSKIYDAQMPGTKAEKIAHAIATHGTNSSNTWMIGDSRSDIRHGKEAGVSTIAVTYGWQSHETLLLENPDYIANTPLDILNCLRI